MFFPSLVQISANQLTPPCPPPSTTRLLLRPLLPMSTWGSSGTTQWISDALFPLTTATRRTSASEQVDERRERGGALDSLPHVQVTCPRHMSSSHVHVTCPRHMSTSHVLSRLVTCPCHMSSSHVHVTCQRHMSSSHVHVTCPPSPRRPPTIEFF